MQIVNLPDDKGYHNLYSESGFPSGKSLIIKNNSSRPLFVIQQPTKPLDTFLAYPVLPLDSVLVHATDDPIWVKGSNGPIVVQSLLETITPYTGVDLPHDLYTSMTEGGRRLKTDVGQTSFFEGREARTFFEFNIPSNSSVTIKAVSPVNIILFSVGATVDSSGIRLITVAGGTETQPFNTTVPVLSKNNMTSRPTPFYVPQATLSTGGSITGGVTIDIVRIVAANATAQQTSVGSESFSERGVNPGTYYWVIENLSNGNATGVFRAFWEERP